MGTGEGEKLISNQAEQVSLDWSSNQLFISFPHEESCILPKYLSDSYVENIENTDKLTMDGVES